MTTDLLQDPAAQHLKELARAAAFDTAPLDLAPRVLGQARNRRRTGLGIAALGTLACGGAIAAAALSGGRFVLHYQPSESMAPTVAVAEQVELDRTLQPVKGDVVLYDQTIEQGRYEFLKRVVALGGDTIACPPDSGGRCRALLVNGIPQMEPYVTGGQGEPFSAVQVPAGHLFMLGDARDVSADSRQYGTVPQTDVQAVAVQILGTDGSRRPVAGAPAHETSGDGAHVDPADPVPPAPASPAS